MAKLPSYKRLNKNDYDPKYADLVDRLVVSINSGFDAVYEALNNKLTLSNNLVCNIKEFTVTVDSNGLPLTPASISISFKNTVSVILVGKITNLKNPTTYPSSGIVVSWEQTSRGLVLIKHISGLLPNVSYNLRLVIYGEEN